MHQPLMKSPKHEDYDDYRRSPRHSGGGTTPSPRPEPVLAPTPTPETSAEHSPYLMITVSLLDTGIPGICEVYFQGKTKKAPFRILRAAKANVLLGPHEKGDINCEGLLAVPFVERVSGTDRYLVKVVDAETAQEFSAEMFTADVRRISGEPFTRPGYFPCQTNHDLVRSVAEKHILQWPGWSYTGGAVWLGGTLWRVNLRRTDQPHARLVDIKEFLLVCENGGILGGIEPGQ